MNKSELINKLGVIDIEKKNKLKKVLDIISRVDKEYLILCTDFLSPDLTGYLEKIFFEYRDLDYLIVGGYPEAEYVRVLIYPDYIMKNQINLDDYISIIEVTYNTNFGDIGHRDILGSLMGLGIRREKIGDILLEDERSQIVVHNTMADYIEMNLNKIGKVKVTSKIINLNDVLKKEYNTKNITTTVKSLRLDSVIASGFNISRSKACELIKLERVKVNFSFVKNTSKILQEKDMISVRKQGRIVLEEVGNLTKKDRYKVSIKKFL